MELRILLKEPKKYLNEKIFLSGWIRNHRKQKEYGFIDFYDGTMFQTMQLVYDNKLVNFEEIQKIKIGSSIRVEGTLIESQGKQDYEVAVSDIVVVGDCPDEYPIQPKRHTREFLREQSYLRPRTNLFQAVFRVRSVAAHAIHSYFQDRDFIYVHTPIITSVDCEGSGEMFKLTTLDLNNVPKNEEGKVNYRKDLFGKEVYITGSGQLHGEAFALSFKNIYTFGPTLRTENSNTKTHANEFWMIEPEIAFCDINGLMEIEEEMLKYIVKYVLDKCSLELEFLDKFVENGLLEKLNKLVNSTFSHITHKEAIELLQKADRKWEFEPKQGEDIAKGHEKYITEYFGGPVFITDWPKDIKAFYMKQNPDNETVAAVDLEVPGAGELMGGSQREDNYELLLKRMKELNINSEGLDWYLNLRRYGGCEHAGFGMGFERLLIYLTGIENIRDVIPFPRTPNNCDL